MRNDFQKCSLAVNVPLTVVIAITPVKDQNFPHESEKIKMVKESDCDDLR